MVKGAIVFLLAVSGSVCFSAVIPDEKGSPAITLFQSQLTADDLTEWAGEIGASHIWMRQQDLAAADRDAAFLKSKGLTPVYMTGTSTSIGPVRSTDDWVYSYLHTPWHSFTNGAGSIDLMASYVKGRFEPAVHVAPERYVYVQEKNSGGLIPRESFALSGDKRSVMLLEPEPAAQYRVLFLAGDRRMLDPGHHHHGDKHFHFYTTGLMPEGRARQMEALQKTMDALPSAEVIRPTSYLHYGVSLSTPDGEDPARNIPVAHSWYAYWRGMHPALLEEFESLHGIGFDPRWIADSHYGEEGFVPEEGYLLWIDFINRKVVDFVREYVSTVHAAGKKVRWFYGDQHVGLEPFLGDLDETGHDELVTSANNQTPIVRHIMSFPGKQKRILRLPWIHLALNDQSKQVDEARFRDFMNEWNVQWRAFMKAMLFRCPDGITVGGNTAAAARNETATAEIRRIAGEFRTVFERCHGRTAFVHPVKMYVLNAWGPRLSWPVANHYTSQDVFKNMVDWPVEIEWLSFRQVVEKGVPEDATLLYIVGEPGTAWSGGRYWNDPVLTGQVRRFVENGGGLLLQGGPMFVDGRFVLGDLTGLEYAGAPSEPAAAQLWNHNRWVAAGNDPEAYPRSADGKWREDWLRADKPGAEIMPVKTIGIRDPRLLAHLNRNRFEVQIDSSVRPSGDVEVLGMAEDGSTGIFLRQAGRGRVVYAGGYGFKDWGRVLKVLTFVAAGRPELLGRLDADNEYVRTTCYPQERLLIVYNSSGSEQVSRVRFDPAIAGLNGARIRLEHDGGAVHATAEELRRGMTVSLDAGEIRYYSVSEFDE